MVCLNSHCRSATDCQSQEYRCGAMQGAELNKQAICLGCHQTRMHNTSVWCSVNGELQRNVQPYIQAKTHTANKNIFRKCLNQGIEKTIAIVTSMVCLNGHGRFAADTL